MELTEQYSSWKVLIVDDEPDNLKLAGDLLEFTGAHVVLAHGGEEALRQFEEHKPNIVLLDLAMPEVDGWMVHRRLRARPDTATIPIIALTALAMAADAERVHSEGFDGYITKPFRVTMLLDTVTACVQTMIRRASVVPAVPPPPALPEPPQPTAAAPE